LVGFSFGAVKRPFGFQHITLSNNRGEAQSCFTFFPVVSLQSASVPAKQTGEIFRRAIDFLGGLAYNDIRAASKQAADLLP
jgi:hypothetical protein